MRIKIGRVVDVSKPVNLVKLSKFDRILYSALEAYHNNPFYLRRVAETVEKEEERKRQLREHLTDGLLSVIYNQITMNQILKTKNEKCIAVLIEIPSKYTQFIDDVISTSDFIAYDMQHIKPNRDASKFSKDLPHLVKISQRKEVIQS